MVPVRDYVRETGDDHKLLAKGQLEVRRPTTLAPKFYCTADTAFGFKGFKLRPLSVHDFFGDESDVDSLELPFVDAVEDRERLDEVDNAA